MIEAAILGRPVFSIETGEFGTTQRGTLHYRYLLPENGGFVRVAESLTEHVLQLSVLMRSGVQRDPTSRGFVERFVRPFGEGQAATPLVADAIEATARETERVAVKPPAGAGLVFLKGVLAARLMRQQRTRAELFSRATRVAADRARAEAARRSRPGTTAQANRAIRR